MAYNDPLQERLYGMERSNPSENNYNQSFFKQLKDNSILFLRGLEQKVKQDIRLKDIIHPDSATFSARLVELGRKAEQGRQYWLEQAARSGEVVASYAKSRA